MAIWTKPSLWPWSRGYFERRTRTTTELWTRKNSGVRRVRLFWDYFLLLDKDRCSSQKQGNYPTPTASYWQTSIDYYYCETLIGTMIYLGFNGNDPRRFDVIVCALP